MALPAGRGGETEVEALKALMRFISYLFHAILALFLIAVSGVALASGEDLQLRMLPWSGSTLEYVVFFSALFGLIAVILALRGTLRVLFLIWAVAVAGFLLKGYIFSGYRFSGNFSTAAYLIAASLVALPGAWFQFRRKAAPTKRFQAAR
jgi:ABC-type maltose transport system permease subunit